MIFFNLQTMETNEALLTQIMLLVQNLHQDITMFDQRVRACETSVVEVGEKVATLIRDAFPEGDLQSHKAWHESHKRGAIRNWLLKVLT